MQETRISAQEEVKKRLILDLTWIAASVLLLHGVLAFFQPIIYGGDTIIRLVSYPRVFIAYQLPLFQMLVHLMMRWFYGPAAIWVLMAFISALGCMGLYLLAMELDGRRDAACLAAIFLSGHPFIMYYSRVPYQEPLLAAGIIWGVYFYFRSNSPRDLLWSGLAIGIACLTRYEGWIAAAVLFGFSTVAEGPDSFWTLAKRCARSLGLYGWAPLLWLFWHWGLSPGGTFVIDTDLSWARFYRPYFILKSAIWWTSLGVAFISLVGWANIWSGGVSEETKKKHGILAAFVVAFLCALVMSGHGIEPDPERMVTEREAYLVVVGLALYAGCGASSILRWAGRVMADRRAAAQVAWIIVLIAVFAAGLYRGIDRIRTANNDPELKTDYEIAQFLMKSKTPALILASPLPRSQLVNFLRRAEKAGGKSGLRDARRLLREAETTPFDYQRVLAYSWMGRERVISSDSLRGMDADTLKRFLMERRIETLVVFSDFSPTEPHERDIVTLCDALFKPAAEIRNGRKLARIYARDLRQRIVELFK